MANVANEDVTPSGGISAVDAFFISGYKVATEVGFGMIPMIGDGNYISGATKLATGLVVAQSTSPRSTQARYASTAMVIDGTEDIVHKFRRDMNLFENSTSTSASSARTI